jgi:hypothetical protein
MSISYSVETASAGVPPPPPRLAGENADAPRDDFHRTANPFAPEGIPATPGSGESEPS